MQRWARPLAFVLLVVGVAYGMARSSAKARQRQAAGAGADDMDFDALLKRLGGQPAGGRPPVGILDDDDDDYDDDLPPDVLEGLLRGGAGDSVSADFEGASFGGGTGEGARALREYGARLGGSGGQGRSAPGGARAANDRWHDT